MTGPEHRLHGRHPHRQPAGDQCPGKGFGRDDAQLPVADDQGFFTQWSDVAKEKDVKELYQGDPNVENILGEEIKCRIDAPEQPVTGMVFNTKSKGGGSGSSANVWAPDSAQGKLLEVVGFELAEVPEDTSARAKWANW